MCSYTMQNCSFKVCDGDMPLLPFQSGCERQIQNVKDSYMCSNGHFIFLGSHTKLTRPCHNKHAVLSSVVGPSVTFSTFQPY